MYNSVAGGEHGTPENRAEENRGWMQAEGNYRRAFHAETLGALQVEIQVEPVALQCFFFHLF